MIRRYQYQSQSFPVFFGPETPVVTKWYQPLAEPLQPPRIHPSAMPFLSWVYLPPVDGCIELEITEFLSPRGVARPNMPILYITSWNRYNTIVPPCRTTRQSPNSQPQNPSS
jgi:hypothetical protein